MNRNATVAAFVVLFIAFLLFEPSAASQINASSNSSDWPMFHHDSMHSGYSTSTAPSSNQTLWTYKTGGAVGSPAAANGHVYVGSNDRNIYCLNRNDVTFIWQYPTDNWVRSSPAVAEGKVYFGTDGGNIYALNASDGAFIWQYSTVWGVFSSPAAVDSNVYVGSDDGHLYAFGSPQSAVPTPTPILSTAASPSSSTVPETPNLTLFTVLAGVLIVGIIIIAAVVALKKTRTNKNRI